jgi:hypothetical protein
MGSSRRPKRALDDEEYAKKLDGKYSKITDAAFLAENYRQGARVWNKDMTVDPAAIRVVLEDSPTSKARAPIRSAFMTTRSFRRSIAITPRSCSWGSEVGSVRNSTFQV